MATLAEIMAAKRAASTGVANTAKPASASVRPSNATPGVTSSSSLRDKINQTRSVSGEPVYNKPTPLTKNDEFGETKISTAVDFQHESQPDLVEEWQGIKRALQMLEQSLDDKQQIAQNIAYVMQSIAAKPALKDNLAAEDLGLMVRSLRIGYGVAIDKKNEKVTKTSERKRYNDEIGNALLGGLDFNNLGAMKMD